MRDSPSAEKLDKLEIVTYCIFIGYDVSAGRIHK